VSFLRLNRLAKVLIFIFLLLYTAPIFIYTNNLVFEKYFFLIMYFFVLMLMFLENINIKTKYNPIVINKYRFYSLLFLLISAYVVIFLLTKDNYIEPFNRSTRNSIFLQGNAYVILDIVIKAIFCILIYSQFVSQNNKNKRAIIVFLVIFAMAFDIVYLGARRTSVFIFVALVWAIVPFIKSKKYILLLFSLITLGIVNFLISGFRELVYLGNTNLTFDQIIASSLLSNEYQLVSENFIKYKDYANSFGFGYGITIFSFPLLFVPRFIWNEKPLTIDKSTEIFPNLLGELYYNFGVFSIFFLLIYMFLIFYWIKKKNIFSMVVFSLIPELFRTSFSIFLFTLILYFIFINFFIIKIDVKKSFN